MFWKKKALQKKAEKEELEKQQEESVTEENLSEKETDPLSKTKMNYQLRFYEPGGVVFYEGEIGDCFYDIIEGVVGVYRHYEEYEEELLGTLAKGDYFGEMAIIESCPRTATIVALKSGTIVRLIDQSCLGQYAEECPENVLRIMLSMGKRMNKLTKDINQIKGVVNTMLEKHPHLRKLKSDEARAVIKLADAYIPEKNPDPEKTKKE